MENILKRQTFLAAVLFGDNDYKQCDIPNDVKNKKIKRIILGGKHSALLFEDGSAVLLNKKTFGLVDSKYLNFCDWNKALNLGFHYR